MTDAERQARDDHLKKGPAMPDVEPLECVNTHHEDGCEGPIEYRMPLSGTGESFPRCDRHWQIRLELEERLRRDYPDTDTPPAWFDPLNAGECWNPDD